MRWMQFIVTKQEHWGRIFGFLTFGFFLVRQLLPQSLGGMYPGIDDLLFFTRWCLVTLLFVLFFHAYVQRTPALSLANRPREILLPLICAPLPIVMIVLCQIYFSHGILFEWANQLGFENLFTPWAQQSNHQVRTGLIIMALGELITVWGMFYLRSSFSIFTEARSLVSQGLYRWVRHPLYLGEIISVWGYAFILPNTITLFSSSLFTVLQVLRAKVEEAKLLQVHPEYALIQAKTGFLLPKFF